MTSAKKYAGQHTVTTDGTSHPYDVFTSKRKTMTLRVRPDGRITVDAPTGTPVKTISDFVASRSAWILKHQAKAAVRAETQPPRRYVDGEKWQYLGRAYTLRYEPSHHKGVSLVSGEIIVCAKSSERIPKILRAWYLEHARDIFNDRMDYLAPAAAALGITPPSTVAIREMKSKWGSCSSTGRITLNLKLVQLQSDLIDYVIAHELCHLRELNHSVHYYALLEAIVPDWKEKRRILHTIQVAF